jgi:O-antigen/teichoic acid export membrane protein
VAEKFVTLFTLVVTSFRQAWWPIAMDALNSSDGPVLFRTMGRIYMGLGTIAIIVLTAVSPWLIRLLTTPLYYSAYTVVGILAWQPLFFGLYLIVSGGVWKREKTNWTPIGMAVAIALNLVLVLLLVPRYELIGAATATGLAYLGWNVFSLIISERLWPVQYPVGIFALQIGIGILTMIGILLLYAQDMGIVGIGQVGIATILSSGLILAITIKRSQVQWVLSLIKQRQVSLMGGK